MTFIKALRYVFHKRFWLKHAIVEDKRTICRRGAVHSSPLDPTGDSGQASTNERSHDRMLVAFLMCRAKVGLIAVEG
jgi:hypothetical protein